jgi:hypothetical protein
LYRHADGRPAQLAYAGHLLMENRSGRLVNARLTPADGFGARDAARVMLEAVPGGRITAGMDKGYAYPGFGTQRQQMAVTPHAAQTTTARRSAIDGRTTRPTGDAVSRRKRKLVAQAFGWMKTVGGMRKRHHRGGLLVAWMFTVSAAADNIVRFRRLLPTSAERDAPLPMHLLSRGRTDRAVSVPLCLCGPWQ